MTGPFRLYSFAMKRSLRAIVLAGIIAALLAAFGGVAQGQDDAPAIVFSGEGITVDDSGEEPAYSVAEPGTYDVTITGSGFTVDVFVLQCQGAAGDLQVLVEGDPTTLCDLGNLLPGSPVDGAFEVTFEGVEIGGCGLVFAAGDAAGTESAAAVITVENPPADVECEVVEAEGYDEDLAGTGAQGEGGEGGEGGDDALADTGLNSAELAIIATVVLLAGWLVTTEARRMNERRLTR